MSASEKWSKWSITSLLLVTQTGGKWRKAPSEHRIHVQVLLTDILLLELSSEMSLHKGSFTSSSIPDQDKLQESIQLTLVPTGSRTVPEKKISHSRHILASVPHAHPSINRNKCRLDNKKQHQRQYLRHVRLP